MPTGDTCTGKSAVHGTGLFAARAMPARHALGAFDGARLTSAGFAQRKAARGRCLLRYTDLDGKEVFLDGEGRSDRAFVNSVAGTGLQANVEFVCDGECLQVYTLRAVAEGEELLADYELVRARGAAPAGACLRLTCARLKCRAHAPTEDLRHAFGCVQRRRHLPPRRATRRRSGCCVCTDLRRMPSCSETAPAHCEEHCTE